MSLVGRDKPRPAYVSTLSDGAWRNASLAERALHVAAHADANPGRFDEFPRGSNWGPMVKLYLAVAGFTKPAAWCVAGVAWCLVESGADRKRLPRFAASTYYWWDWARTTGRLVADPNRVRRGMVFIGNSGTGHGGFVSRTDGNKFHTLEGNSNDEGSREGYEWCRNERSIRGWLTQWKRAGFIVIGDDLFEVEK